MKRSLFFSLVFSSCSTMLLAAEQQPRLHEAQAAAPQLLGKFPQYAPQVAWSAASKTWLVVWEDGWAASDETVREGRAQDIFAARIATDGSLLDREGIVVCGAKDFQGRPTVASDGSDFLVLWQDMRNGSDLDLYATRISAAGKVLDQAGILVAGGQHNQCLPTLQPMGDGYYAVWLDARAYPEYRLYGTRLAKDGRPLDGNGRELIRAMSDGDVEKLKAAPFAPGKHGQGWHNTILQPYPPLLAVGPHAAFVLTWASGWTDGLGEGGTRGRHLMQRLNPTTGEPTGSAEMLPLNESVNSHDWFYSLKTKVRSPAITAIGDKGFLLTAFYHRQGFGADGNGLRLAFQFDAEGHALMEGKFMKVQAIVRDKQQHGLGYRSYGLRPNTLAVAWDGKRALHVADRYSVAPKSTTFDYDIVAIFLDGEGRRLSNLESGSSVEADRYSYDKTTRKQEEEDAKIEPFVVAEGQARQSCPAVAAGEEGSFLIVWQEEVPHQQAQIMTRLVTIK